MSGLGHRRIIQANINHCRSAQDLLLQSMAEWGVDIAVVAEPYLVPVTWLGDRDGSVAIVLRQSRYSLPFSLVQKGNGFVVAKWGEIAIVGVYFSPNRPLAEFETFLEILGGVVSRLPLPSALVLGDLNAKSTLWGNTVTRVRGRSVEQWSTSLGLTVLNRGTVHTCVRHNGGSIVDLSFATFPLAPRVQNWRVELTETLSDHRYIRFEIATQRQQGMACHSVSPFPRWAITRLDEQMAREAAFVQAWFEPNNDDADVDRSATRLRESLTEICNSSMPRCRRPHPSRALYWWTEEIAALRAACITAKRAFTRSRRRRIRNPENEARLHSMYSEAKRVLKAEIGASKDRAREEMLRSLDDDPWGRPYKVARNKLRPIGPPITETLQPDILDVVVQGLFPIRPIFTPPTMDPPDGFTSTDAGLPPITAEELGAAALRICGKRTAPGPDGIPARVIHLALSEMEDRLRSLFNRSLSSSRFPKVWKEGILCLLRKEGRPEDSASGYRPIVLLDEVGKLFERIIASRLVNHLSSVGPDLADEQFGFRAERSTIDALSHLKLLVQESKNEGDGMLAIKFDIQNAFNTLPHSSILEALRFHGVPLYLQTLIENYLDERKILYVNKYGCICHRDVKTGVPQGSVLGPLLWNIGYNWVLRGTLLAGMSIICYADDTLVTARGKDFREAAQLAAVGGALVVQRIRCLGLKVALHKTEAIFFHARFRRMPPEPHIIVDGVRVDVKTQMKYLGLLLDSRWQFGPHFRELSPRIIKAANSFGWLLPNLGGPSSSCRRLYAGVLKSMTLYGAPIWADSLNVRENATHLRRPQRAIAQRVIRAYRTVSFDVACALAGTPPWVLEAEVLAAVYKWTADQKALGIRPSLEERMAVRREAREVLIRRWIVEITNAVAGRRVLDALGPPLEKWLERRHGFLSYRMVQVLTGHGCFGSYLHRIGREATPSCHECGATMDSAYHTLSECVRWAQQRHDLMMVVGQNITLTGVVSAILESLQSWIAFATFCEKVMTLKEAAERQREEDPSAIALRRRRSGRRRREINRGSLPLPDNDQQRRDAGASSSALHRSLIMIDRDNDVLSAIPVTPERGLDLPAM